MRLVPKKSMSDDQLYRFGDLGNRVGLFLRSNRRWRYLYLWLSAGGRRHTKVVSAFLLLFCSIVLSWGIYSSISYSKDQNGNLLGIPPSLGENGTSYDDSIRRTQEKIDALLLEAQTIGDSIQTLISKGKISRAESIYVIEQTTYLSELNKIIQR